MFGGSFPAYSGMCPTCGREHHFKNDPTKALGALADLFSELEAGIEVTPVLQACGGKMVGALVAVDAGGQHHVLRAFSGDLLGKSQWAGFVPSVMDRTVTADLEAWTLARLAELERELASCDVDGARAVLAQVEAEVAAVAVERREAVRAQRQQRAMARRSGVDVTAAAEDAVRANHAASALELERINAAKRLVREREETRRTLRESRRKTSATLMAAMFDGMVLTNARGERRGLRDVFMGGGIPSGTAECAAPKLLNAANVAGLRPLALAEAWWGPSQNGRNHGDLQAPCTKCLPILGHLLCGTEER